MVSLTCGPWPIPWLGVCQYEEEKEKNKKIDKRGGQTHFQKARAASYRVDEKPWRYRFKAADQP